MRMTKYFLKKFLQYFGLMVCISFASAQIYFYNTPFLDVVSTYMNFIWMSAIAALILVWVTCKLNNRRK